MPSGPYDKTVMSTPTPYPWVLQVFSSFPDITFHVQEVVLLNIQISDNIVNARALLCIVGSTLERLTLRDASNNFRDVAAGLSEFFVEALQLSPNLKSLDLVIQKGSQKWWASGGKEELAMAIITMGQGVGTDFTSMMVEGLKPAQLSEGLVVRSRENEVDTLVRQVAKQKAVKRLGLLLYSLPTAEGLNKARALALFADFDRLQSLNVTFSGFTYMSSAFSHLSNLRHLTMGSMECYDENVWNNFSEVLKSGNLSRLESFDYFAEDCYARERETGLFHLLKDGNALKRFRLVCSDHYCQQEDVMPALDEIFADMIPKQNLESIRIVFYMADLTLLRFAKFISGCRKLNELYLQTPTREDLFTNDADRYQFLSDITSAPSLTTLSLPLKFPSGRLELLDRCVLQRPLEQQRLKEVTLKVALDSCLFHDLTVFLERPSSIESFEIDMEDSGDRFGPHLIKFFEWLTFVNV
ncbi:hypothetical protein BC829DRAFT_439863 [Chytridium lagenaria]|nr:hypothetical protein BC829DRAFT_439863 [Chytridium lagenaria]